MKKEMLQKEKHFIMNLTAIAEGSLTQKRRVRIAAEHDFS
jgi:hypothetical protein